MTLDPFTHDAAAYVLGALGPAQRRTFEEHLAGCAECAGRTRDLAGIPGLLARLDETAFLEPDPGAHGGTSPPEALLPRLVERVRRQRRRHRLALGVSTAAAVVLAVLLGVSLLPDPEPAPDPLAGGGRAMAQVDQRWVRASVAMEQVPWGTRMRLLCTYATGRSAGPPPAYALVVRTADGEQQVATWRAVPGRTTRLDAATAYAPGQIIQVEVVLQPSGRRVLSLDRAAS